MPPPTAPVPAEPHAASTAVLPRLCGAVLTAALLAAGAVLLVAPRAARTLLYPCLARRSAESDAVTVLEGDALRLAGAALGAVALASLGLLVAHGALGGGGGGVCLRTLLFLHASMGLSLVGIGIVNLNASEATYQGGPVHCSSLQDQSILWMGVGMVCVTSLGVMASLWPAPSREDSQGADTDPRAGGGRWCEMAHTTPLLVDEAPLLVDEAPLLVDEERDAGRTRGAEERRTAVPDQEESPGAGPAPATTSRLRGTSRLLRLAGGEALSLWAGVAVLLVRLPFSLSIPHCVATALACLVHADYDGARRQVLLIFCLGTVDAVLDYWCIFLFGRAKENIVRAVRVDTFSSILRQEPAFFDAASTGDLLSRLTSDCGEMAQDLTWFFRFSVEATVRITGITVYMLLRSPVLGACTLAIVPAVGLLNQVYGAWLSENASRVQSKLADATSCAHESLACIKTVLTLACEDEEREKYRREIDKMYDLNMQQLIATALYFMVVSTFLINTCVQAALLLLGSIFIEQGTLSSEVLLAFVLYQGQLQEYTLNLFQSYSSLIKSSGAGDRIFFLLDRHPPAPGTGNAGVRSCAATDPGADGTGGDITLAGVSFSYPTRPDHRALERVSLKIESGSFVALVGHSGCGKSTLVSLLERLYDPDEGTIKFGDTDLRSMCLETHRKKIGLVTQDPVLFSGTIEENVRYGSAATFEEIVAASRVANADGFITQFPNQYQEQVGERGQSLSGGQKQRIAIARALVRKPTLLLLDEATSSLDPDSEAAVQEALSELLRNRCGMTTVVIAHRLQTVRGADTIFVIRNGSVAEHGTHAQLAQRETGQYRHMLDRVDSAGILPG